MPSYQYSYQTLTTESKKQKRLLHNACVLRADFGMGCCLLYHVELTGFTPYFCYAILLGKLLKNKNKNNEQEETI
jgi:hypothetical protein